MRLPPPADYGWTPPGEERLIIGHESLGQVIETAAGTGFSTGDSVRGDATAQQSYQSTATDRSYGHVLARVSDELSDLACPSGSAPFVRRSVSGQVQELQDLLLGHRGVLTILCYFLARQQGHGTLQSPPWPPRVRPSGLCR